ncbi:adenosylmethionine--8-amino-7-oxononanoate transaminase [Anaerohalosphaera lusitana]|uniref:adenosylmethionine--8-amino-7-oxononanoate transaminase n=1 Tax=Anaerohalosphaera lusitana TaxID=1936003 RepID=UPI003AABFBD1
MMNESTKKLLETDRKHLWYPFTQMKDWLEDEPVIIESGDGFYLVDTEGRRYIDGVSSLWCNVHGHRVKEIDDAVKGQLGKIAHSTMLGLGQEKAIELAGRLAEISPEGLERVFYSDSGATSVEIAIKMAYQYWRNQGDTKRTKFIALGDAYHGDTIGSVSVGGIGLFHGIFRSLLFETYYVDSPFVYRYEGTEDECRAHGLEQMEALLKNNEGQIAGIVVEPLVQGAAGILVHPEGFLKGVEELARKYGVLLIVDEVATGFGKTGRMFACEKEDVRPDFMCMAKGISGGYLPLAATVTTEKVFEAFLGEPDEHKTFYHGHTYTGNALGCAAAIASLDLFEKNDVLASLDAKIAKMEEWAVKIRELPFVGDARHVGLFGGIELVRDKESKEEFDYEQMVARKLILSMRDKGLMVRNLGNVVVLMPPVGMSVELLDEMMSIIYDSIRDELPGIVESA